MSITIAIEINREFDVRASIDEVFALLADVPKSVSHFPKVDELVDLGNNSYRWVMQKVGVDTYAMQTVYACKYTSDAAKKQITWTPIKGEGNGLVKGIWKLAPSDGGTHVSFKTEAELTMNLPALLKLAISPVVKHEFNALVDTYTRNLRKALDA